MRYVDRARLGLAIAGLVVLGAQLVYWLPNHATRDVETTDVPGYYRAAAHVLAGEPIYGEELSGQMGAYLYPPVFAVVISPLAALGQAKFQAVWYFGIFVAFWAFAAGLVRLSGRSVTAGSVLAAGAVLQFFPGTTTTMSFGNADMVVWALCAAALAGSPVWAGVAGAFKIYPAWILFMRSARGIAAGAIAGAALVVLSVAVAGFRGYADWLRVAAHLARGVDWPTNVSLSFRAAHALGRDGLTSAFGLAGTAAAVVATRALVTDETTRGVAVLVAAMAFGPVCWVHYAPALLMVCAVALRRSSGGAVRRRQTPQTLLLSPDHCES